MTDQEVGEEFRHRSSERRAKALARVEPLDLTGTTWPEFPHPDVVAAVTYAARGALNRPPDPEARELRAELARRHGLEVERVVAGHGAAQLLESAFRSLLGPEDELICPWPTWSLLPVLARGAGGRAVPVAGALSAENLLSAVTERTRVVALAHPNDPTGEWLGVDELRSLATALPQRVWIILDEALIDFAPDEAREASLELLDDLPRLLVVRTLSKAYGLAGLRCGWMLGPPDSADLLARLAPAGGLSTPVQAGGLEALIECGPLVATRRAIVATQRARILETLTSTPYSARDGHANVLWVRHTRRRGDELASSLERLGVYVARGEGWGDPDHVRIQVQGGPATDRLLDALARTG